MFWMLGHCLERTPFQATTLLCFCLMGWAIEKLGWTWGPSLHLFSFSGLERGQLASTSYSLGNPAVWPGCTRLFVLGSFILHYTCDYPSSCFMVPLSGVCYCWDDSMYYYWAPGTRAIRKTKINDGSRNNNNYAFSTAYVTRTMLHFQSVLITFITALG